MSPLPRFYRRQYFAVLQSVLGDAAWMTKDTNHVRIAFDVYQSIDVRFKRVEQLVVAEIDGVGIRCAAVHGAEEHVSFGDLIWKDGRRPDGTERADALIARCEESEPVEIVVDLVSAESGAKNGDRRVGNAIKGGGEIGV